MTKKVIHNRTFGETIMIRDLTLGDSGTVGRVIAALPEAVLTVGADDRVLEINPPAQTLFPGLRIGAPLARILRSPDILDAIAQTRLSGKPSRTSWLERVPVERVFEVNVAAVEGLDVGPVLIIYFREISETRRFERMRIDFVANASHELRTPLASLLGFIETLQGSARNDATARTRFLAIMREQAQRMARLVDDLLSLSRIEQHLHLQPRQPVDLSLVLRHITDTLAPLADDNGVTVLLDADTPVIVSGDRDELLRVAENLIENAIKYGASDGGDKRVEVTASLDDGDGVIAVRDFGPGIASEHLPRLTERFYRIDAGASRAKGGTGLGLAIVKHIVARHRGRLKIESTAGAGAVFRVFLPLYNA
jgi:two-component system phosphate regulon sensor histidine kinase PhoR